MSFALASPTQVPQFPRIIAGGDYYSREAIILNIAHWKLCPKCFVLFSHWKKKGITSNKLNMGFSVFQIWFLDYFSMSMSSASELESSPMGFAASSSTSSWQGRDKWKWLQEGWGGGAIIRGRRLIEGRDYSRKYGNLASVGLEGLN